MIHFSFSSVFMTVLVSNFLLIVIALLFRNEDVLAKIGFKLTAIFCIITLIRFLFPFELPFAKTIAVPSGVSYAIAKVRHRYDIFPGLQISVWDIFCIIWLAESIRRLSILLYRYWKLRRLIRDNSVDVTEQEPYISILMELCTKRQRRKIRLLTTRFVNVPMVMGLRNALILLPVDIDTSDMDVMYALRHEIYHYMHHDLWLKFAVNCLVAAYWWNPFTHLLSRQINILLEMRVDDSIISDGEEATIDYLTSIVHYMGGDPDRDDIASHHTGLALKKTSSLSHRLCMIQSKGQKRNHLLSAVLLLIISSIYIGSYLFILENSSYRQEITESDIRTVPSDEDFFAIRNSDGTFTIYIPCMGISENVTTLEHYKGITIYSSEEEYKERANLALP